MKEDLIHSTAEAFVEVDEPEADVGTCCYRPTGASPIMGEHRRATGS